MIIKTRFVALTALTLLLALSANFAAGQSGYDLCQQALKKERAEGKLPEAIQLYQRIIKNFPKDRAIAAKAWLQLGICYEKQGNAEARKTFERVVKEFADQSDSVALAKDRLNAMPTAAPALAGNQGLTIRKLDYRMGGAPSPDGRYFAAPDKDLDLAIHELATGTVRKITRRDVKNKQLIRGSFSGKYRIQVPRTVENAQNLDALPHRPVENEKSLESSYGKHSNRCQLRMGKPALPSHGGLAGKKIERIFGRIQEAETDLQTAFTDEIIRLVIQVLVRLGEKDISSAHRKVLFFLPWRSRSRLRLFCQ